MFLRKGTSRNMTSKEHLEKASKNILTFFLKLQMSSFSLKPLCRQGQGKKRACVWETHPCIAFEKSGGCRGHAVTVRNVSSELSKAWGLVFTAQPSWWNLLNLISKQDGKTFCRRTACDCQNPSVDLFCCPECDTRVTSQCLDQKGHKLYRSGDNWTHSCQQCRCLVCQLPSKGICLLLLRVAHGL